MSTTCRPAGCATDPSGALKQPQLLPFAPQSAAKTSNTVVNQTSSQTLCSITITTDGVTDIEIA